MVVGGSNVLLRGCEFILPRRQGCVCNVIIVNDLSLFVVALRYELLVSWRLCMRRRVFWSLVDDVGDCWGYISA